MQLHIELTTTPAPEDIASLNEGIQQYNRQAVPGTPEVSEDLHFAVFARDSDGHVLGGIRSNPFSRYLCI